MARSALFEERLALRAQEVEAALHLLLPAEGVYPNVIHESMRYSALGGGKRLRGLLVMEAATVAGAKDDWDADGVPVPATARITRDVMERVGAVRAAAAAVEMIHAYSLIHDDLPCMDDDDLRRGKPTNHKVYGEGLAVLAGDALLTRAFEVMTRLPWAGCDAAKSLALVAELAVAGGTAGLIGGQVADLESEGRLERNETQASDGWGDSQEQLEYIHAHKTGALFRAAVRIGGLIGGADEARLAQLDEYAACFGLAFQIVDDLLDVEGDEAVLGKGVGADARRGKLTFPALYGVDQARALATEQIERAKMSVEPFGPQARFLLELAEYVLRRRL